MPVLRVSLGTVLRPLRNLLAAVGALVMVATLSPLPDWWSGWLTGNRWDEPAGETLVVAGAASPIRPGELLSESSYWRAAYAVRAWRTARFRRIVLSGGDGTARSMGRYLIAEGVPADIIRLEEQSRTTEENARFTAALLAGSSTGRIALLTSDFHMRRASAVFERAGFRNLLRLPVPDAGKRNRSWLLRWQVCLELAQETVKLCGYRLSGRA